MTRFISALFLISAGFYSCTPDINKTSSFRDIFDHYRTQPGVAAFSVPPALFSLLLDQIDNQDADELSSLLKDLSAFRMIILEEEKFFEDRKKEISEVVCSFTSRNGFNDFFVLRNSREDLIIRVKEGKENVIQEAVIMVGAEDSFTVIDLRGNIRPEYFTQLAESGIIKDFTELQPWN